MDLIASGAAVSISEQTMQTHFIRKKIQITNHERPIHEFPILSNVIQEIINTMGARDSRVPEPLPFPICESQPDNTDVRLLRVFGTTIEIDHHSIIFAKQGFRLG